MPSYIIEQYEIHSSKYEVEADNIRDAISKMEDGDAVLVDMNTEYIEIPDNIGMSVDMLDEKDFNSLEIPEGEFIPGIRSIKLKNS
jgi:hypothetical protein